MKIIIKRHKFDWYWVPSLLLLWSILFVAIIWWHQEEQLPANKKLHLQDLGDKPEEQLDYFLQQRSQELIQRYDRFGVKVLGSSANEHTLVQFLLNEIKQIKWMARSDLYDIQEEPQYGSGSFITEEKFINHYQGIQYIAVKVQSRVLANVSQDAAVLINCHYDTVIGSPGSGSSGAMAIILLETLRSLLLQTDPIPLQHPVIFLFNGAKESEREGLHAFMTQHRWAPSVR